jgi:hypothetical protein
VKFLKAMHICIDSCIATSYNISALDSARAFDAQGHLSWLGRVLTWSLKPQQAGKFTVTQGCDKYGDYELGGGGSPLHWSAIDIDTGEEIELQ